MSHKAGSRLPFQDMKSHSRRCINIPIATVIGLSVLLYVQLYLLPAQLQPSESEQKLAQFHLDRFNKDRRKCVELNTPPISYSDPAAYARTNSRWNNASGQKGTTILKNVTLFNGDDWLQGPVDIVIHKGLFTAIATDAASDTDYAGAEVLNMNGKYVTPGLVDMHSHHLVGNWPSYFGTDDGNEMNDEFGPLTPFVRSLDGIKPYDFGTDVIRSGGVTTSLILPDSANIIGGEAFVVKNVLRAGKDGEETVEEMLLEHGVPKPDRRRYMKMACGENPGREYKHTRMGNAWKLRKHMERALELKMKQDQWCLAADAAHTLGDAATIKALTSPTTTGSGGLPEELELESSIAVLRGQVGVNIHCYEPEDLEDMLLHSKEFGFHIQAFHHALSAWKVPEIIKDSGENITIATFSDLGFYKHESYDSNLYAGKILEEHGVPVAYKSDHFVEDQSAKYLLLQAAMAHSFGMSEVKALQSVTSVPARSMQQDYRVGYAKVGYDADAVVWDSHPLSLGATPLQVYVDGKPTLDEKEVEKIMEPKVNTESQPQQERVRPILREDDRERQCRGFIGGRNVVINGIRKSFLPGSSSTAVTGEAQTMVIKDGRVVCFDTPSRCASTGGEFHVLDVKHGHALPGLIAVSESLGLAEIAYDDATSDGFVSADADLSEPEKVTYAKYGVHLEGKAFKRAQIGGVTRGVTIPRMNGGLGGGVSVGIKTSEKQTVLNGGIFQSNVGLHMSLGQTSKTKGISTISAAVARIRKILSDNKDKDNIYGKAINGSIPFVVHTDNKYDIMRLIEIKRDVPSLDLVIVGGAGAPAVANELAAANISVIFIRNRGAPDVVEKIDVLVGPPLTPSSASVLAAANVTFGLSVPSSEGNSHIHFLPLEASWAAKLAGLSEQSAVDLVSAKIGQILGIEGSNRDIVIWEGNPLEFGATPAVIIDGDEGVVVGRWPLAT